MIARKEYILISENKKPKIQEEIVYFKQENQNLSKKITTHIQSMIDDFIVFSPIFYSCFLLVNVPHSFHSLWQFLFVSGFHRSMGRLIVSFFFYTIIILLVRFLITIDNSESELRIYQLEKAIHRRLWLNMHFYLKVQLDDVVTVCHAFRLHPTRKVCVKISK